jgi:hypothetical protein
LPPVPAHATGTPPAAVMAWTVGTAATETAATAAAISRFVLHDILFTSLR